MDRESWHTEELDELMGAVVRLDSRDEAARFFRDLCTIGELHDMANRWAIVRLLDAGLHYADISERTSASTATVTRIASWLHHGEGGYITMLRRLREEGPSGMPTDGDEGVSEPSP